MVPISRLLIIAIVISAVALACGGGDSTPTSTTGRVDSYVALAPRVFRSGETESVSLTLFSGAKLARSDVSVALTRDGETVVESAAAVEGKGTVELEVPQDASGEYELTVNGNGFDDSAPVQVQDGTLLFVETDKPIYKPGQTVMMRVVTLNSELKPLSAQATVEIADAKGNKIFKQDVLTDVYGMGSLELPLSTEPNLGVWKVTAKSGDTSTEIDVRVEEYVLPKYEVAVEMSKPWYLVDEPISGHVDATYSFGKPVNGEMTVKAMRYVGIWEEFASVTAAVVDGAADFELAAPGYVAGVAEAGGNGNVQLDISVEERNTGYVEETGELVTVAAAPVTVQLIPETPSFKPGLPFKVLVITETPDGQPVDATVSLGTSFFDEDYNQLQQERSSVDTARGVGTATVVPPEGAQRLSLDGSVGEAYAYKEIGAAYSPSGNFIHVSQLPPTELGAGVEARFHVDSTSEARAFYYEVVARDRVVFTAWSESADFSFEVTPAMAGANKLLVYQVLPNSEVAADFIPFDVEAAYPHAVEATFSEEESQPGDEVTIDVQAQGTAKVGLAAVDRSVFILAENRLNLAQVFDEIERLYQEPQAELHEFEFEGPIVVLPGAEETISDAGLLVMTNKKVPEGEEIESPWMFAADGAAVPEAANEDDAARAPAPQATGAPSGVGGGGAALAEVQRVRQFFPETWIWDEVTTDADGKASLSVESPDSITTWDLRAVAISPEYGLGVAEAEHRVFQPFFLSADLPYSAIRGEEFPLKVSLYNYTETEQEFFVEIEPQAWFELLDAAEKSVMVAPNDTGGVEFIIRTTGVGTQTVKVTARSTDAADAVIKSMIVEPEGVQREYVENGVLAPGGSRTIDLTLPPEIVQDSARASVAITGSLLSQTIQGLDQLLQMPFGCGEQNMLLFAPDAYILKYLQGTSQLTPEIRAKAETLLITGYQRELTYRRSDGSFSAFGDQDPEGSMFLTSFVLRTFAEAKDLIYVDEAVLTGAAEWIASHQNADGSFEDVGFVHHQELLGGIQGRDALTAYATIAMLEGGVPASADKAVAYLEGRLDEIEEPYSLALVTYALELADSGRAGEAYDKLMAAAEEDDDGLHWSGGGPEPLPLEEDRFAPFPGQMSGSSDIEATGYAALALIEHGDPVNAGRAAKWLVGHRNSMGGFGSTQDTVVALQALTRYAADAASDTEMTVTVSAGAETQDVQITAANFDVLQTVEIPAGVSVTLTANGRGQAVFQAVSRYNLPEAEEEESVFDITVDYDTTQVSVNDIVTLDVSLTFQPPVPGTAGMIVLDVAVPTGFAPETETLDAMVAQDAKVKRYDVAGRKVILYIEDMAAGEAIGLSFDVVAQYPVQGKGATSQAYSYYTPEWRGETISEAVTVE